MNDEDDDVVASNQWRSQPKRNGWVQKVGLPQQLRERGLPHSPIYKIFKKLNPFYLVFMQYKCENNVIEQIDEISLTSNLGWIGYATISNR